MRISRKSVHRRARAASLIATAVAWEIFAHLHADDRLYPSLERLLTISFPSLGVFSLSTEPTYLNAVSVISVHAAITIARITGALVLGIPLGIAVGLSIHYLRGSGPFPAAALTIIRSVPLLALIPLFAFWFGSSPLGIFAYICFGVCVVVSSDTYEAAANLSLVHVQQAKLLGATVHRVIRTVYLPGISPAMVGSLRNVLGLCWALALGAEYVSATSGLGYIAYQSYLYSDMGKLAVMAVVYMVLGVGTFTAFEYLTRALLPWLASGEERN